MTDLDVLSDTVFREQAHQAVDRLEAECGANGFWVKRVQIAGLRQIAANQPALLPGFAEKQRMRAFKRREGTKDAAKQEQWIGQERFWELVRFLLEGPANRPDWSLEQFAHRSAAPDLNRSDLRRFVEQAKFANAPAFFQRFCAEYLYRKSNNPVTAKD